MEKFNRLKNKPPKRNDQEVLNPLTKSQFYPFKLQMPENKKKAAIDNFESKHKTFSRLFDLASISYFVLNSSGIIDEVNKSGINLFGTSKLVLQSRRFHTFISPEDQESFDLFLKKMEMNSQKRKTKVTLILSDKKINASIKGLIIKDSLLQHNYHLTVIKIRPNRKTRLLEVKNKLNKLLVEAEELKFNLQKNILAATLEALETERNNISRALHDSVCQLLYGIKINLQCIPDLHPSPELDNVNKLLVQAIKETRDISYSLTPSVLMDFGFTAGIREMSQRLSTASFKINTILSPSLDELNSFEQLYLFRIVQELINNCIKHSAATEVYIRIKEENERIKVVVSDNGKGFQTNAAETFKNGSGLRSIKNQIFLLNGELFIKSNKKRTTVYFTFKRDIEL
jgi:PAS domain S-box-containing protein